MRSSTSATGSHFLAHYRQSDREEQTLWSHLLQTGELAAAHAAKIGLEPIGELLGLIHDLGKATHAFDHYIRSNVGLIDPDEDANDGINDRKGKIDHSTAGAQVLFEYLSKDPADRIAADILPLIVASHHSGLIDCLTPSGQNRLTRRLSKDLADTRKDEAWENLDPTIRARVLTLIHSGVGEVLKSAVQSSIEEGIDGDSEIWFKVGLLTRFLFSGLIDADRLDTADFENPDSGILRNYGKYVSWDSLIDALNRKLQEFSSDRPIDALRREVSENCKHIGLKERGIYRLTVPTGGGKTLASLRFALHHAKQHGLDRIIYILPYTSIIDQNAAVIREILDPHARMGKPSSIVLEHHSNLTPEIETSTQHRLLAENWDAPIVLTTMVQFLEAVFGAGTRSCRRMHQLANAVIIFDEIQTLPIRTIHLFNVALRFLVKMCGSTALLCTATQPLLDQVKPESRALSLTSKHEITPNIKKLYQDLRRVRVINKVRATGWSADEIADLAVTEMNESHSVLIIVNTKKAAAAIFDAVESKTNAAFHLSTNMCPAHRLDVLSQVREKLDRNERVICVSTQLIEAGVDIDFAVVIRSLAGLDSITQAAGRCNRNAKQALGRLVLVNPTIENLDKLVDIKKGRDATERIVHEFSRDPAQFDNDLLSPTALERYFKYYFYDRQEEMDYKVSQNSLIGRTDNLFDLLSKNHRSVAEFTRVNHAAPDIVLRQSFMSAARTFAAIDQSGQGVIVPYKEGEQIITKLCGEIDFDERYALLRRAQRYSVNLHLHELKRQTEGLNAAIMEAGKGSGVFVLDKRYYDKKLGFSANTAELMETTIV